MARESSVPVGALVQAVGCIPQPAYSFQPPVFPTPMERRDLLRAMASAAALTLIPHDQALAAWTRVATKLAPTNGLNDAQMAFVRAIADTIIPRTDTPSATDVGTEKFIDVIVAEYATDEDRTKFCAAIDALDAKSRAGQDAAVADLTPEARGKFIESVESGDRNVDPA